MDRHKHRLMILLSSTIPHMNRLKHWLLSFRPGTISHMDRPKHWLISLLWSTISHMDYPVILLYDSIIASLSSLNMSWGLWVGMCYFQNLFTFFNSAPFVQLVLKALSYRVSAVIGGFLFAVGIMYVGLFANTSWQLFLCLILSGMYHAKYIKCY